MGADGPHSPARRDGLSGGGRPTEPHFAFGGEPPAVPDGTDHGDDPPEPFSEYGEVDETYREPEEGSLGPDIPEAPDLTGNDVDPVIEGAFWTLVVVFNVGLMVTSIGVLFVIFRSGTAFGAQITLAGILILGYGIYRYRNATELVSDRVDDGTDGDGTTDNEMTDDRNE